MEGYIDYIGRTRKGWGVERGPVEQWLSGCHVKRLVCSDHVWHLSIYVTPRSSFE